MRPRIEKLRRFALRYLLGPVELQRLQLRPDDFVLVYVPGGTSADGLRAIADHSVALFPGHRVVVCADGAVVQELPREILLSLLAEARPTPFDYRMEI